MVGSSSKRWKDKRCNFFDDEGRPRRLVGGKRGCSRSDESCYFAHPTDPEWKTAQSSFPPSPERVKDNDSDFYYSLLAKRDRQHSHSSVDPRLARRESVDSSRSRRPDDMPSMRHSSRRSRSPAGSTTSDYYERRPHHGDEHTSRRTYKDEPPLTPLAATSSSRKPDAPKEIHPTRRPSQSNMDPPPVPSMQPPPLPPPDPRRPPAPPNLPSGSTIKSNAAEKKELSSDEKRALWSSRVDIMFASVKARAEYFKTEKDLQAMRRLSQAKSADFPGKVNEGLSLRITQLELQCEAKKKEMNETVDRLIASDFWPALKQPDVKDLESKHSDMSQHLEALKASVNEMYAGMMVLIEKHYGKREKTPGGSNDVASSMDESSNRAVKRRRVEGEDALPEDKVEAGEGDATLKDLEEIREELLKVKSRLSDVENDITQRDNDIYDEMDLRIEAKVQELGAVLSPEEDKASKAELEAAIADQHSSTIKNIEEDINATGEQVGELAVEIGNLMLRSNDTVLQNNQLQAENTELRAKSSEMEAEIVQMGASLQQCMDMLEKNKKDQEVLNAALQAFMSRPRSPPPSVIHPPEYLMQTVEEPILASVRSHIQPLFTQLRVELAEMLRTRNADIYNALWPKLGLTLRMIDTIQARINLGSAEAPPNEAASTG